MPRPLRTRYPVVDRTYRTPQVIHTNTSPFLTGGDLDAQWQLADSCGDEAACGSAMTPDQNVVDEFGAAVGIHYESDEELFCGEKERGRDLRRWELDPASAEDYAERSSSFVGSLAQRWRHFTHNGT